MIKEIDFSQRCDIEDVDEAMELITRAIEATLEEFEFDAGWQVSVSFVDEEEIQKLNRMHRNVDSVTDVLSFPMEETDPRGVEILGDIVLCKKRAQEQAIEFGHSLTREMAYLSVHSTLHLLGYDHMEEEDKVEMRQMEKLIMKKLMIFKSEKELED